METYDRKNIHGDVRLLFALGGIALSPYYVAGASTANLVLTETIGKWTIENNSAGALTVEITSYNDSVTQVIIPGNTSIGYDMIIKSIKLVTALINYVITGQVVSP